MNELLTVKCPQRKWVEEIILQCQFPTHTCSPRTYTHFKGEQWRMTSHHQFIENEQG